MRKGSQTLKRVMDRQFLRDYLGRKARRFWPNIKRVGLVKIEELSKEKFKRSFKYTLPLALADGRQVSWVLRGNVPSRHRLRELATAHWTQRLLRRNGFSGGQFLAPRSLGFDTDLRLFLYADCPGITLVKALKRARTVQAQRLIDDSAEWLKRFHGLALRGRRVWTRTTYVRDLGYFKKNFERAGREWAERAEPVLKKLRSAFDQVWPIRQDQFTLMHGDFSPYNIIVKNGSLTVIDFGNAGQADPLFDLASFTVQLELLGARGRLPLATARTLSRRFLKTYWHGSKNARLKRAARRLLPTYRAWWLAQIAAYIISVEPVDQNRLCLNQTLAQARRELDSVKL